MRVLPQLLTLALGIGACCLIAGCETCGTSSEYSSSDSGAYDSSGYYSQNPNPPVTTEYRETRYYYPRTPYYPNDHLPDYGHVNIYHEGVVTEHP